MILARNSLRRARTRDLSKGALFLVFLAAVAPARAATITVNTAADVGPANDGVCTFREAIIAANTNTASGPAAGECATGDHLVTDTIAFNIPGGGVRMLSFTSALPHITESVTIDGLTQPGSSANTSAFPGPLNAVLLIELNLANAPSLVIDGPSVIIRGLALNNATQTNIDINADDVIIVGCYIGTHADGVTPAASSSAFGIRANGTRHRTAIGYSGGPFAPDRNLITHYALDGILSLGAAAGNGSPDMNILGNFVGTDATGTVSLITPGGLGANGMNIANAVVNSNLVSGNSSAGIAVVPPGNTVIQGLCGTANSGNLIGVQRDGVTPLHNGFAGVIFQGGNSKLGGGPCTGEGNVIAYNAGTGVRVEPGVTGVDIRANSIHHNVSGGISLTGTTTPLPNDACDVDTSPGNEGQNYPVITTANVSGSSVSFVGTMQGKANTTYRIDLFSTASCDASGHGQGETFLGSTTAATDASCSTNFVQSLSFPPGQVFFSATATDTSTDSAHPETSEFSVCFDSGAVAVTSIAPSSGLASGVAGVVASGANFAPGATVTVGGVAAANVAFLDTTSVSFDVPSLAPGAVYPVTVTVPGPSSGTLTNGWFADFLDVPGSNPFHGFVEKLVRNSITAGCAGGNFCPGDSATRGQMAVFLLRSKEGALYTPPPCVTPAFLDVPCSSGFAPWVNELAARGVTAGCGGGNYCPGSAVTRGQMAVFLLRTKEGSAYSPPLCVTPTFLDVPCSLSIARWVDELAARGITAGCGGGNFCPDVPVTRGQMAVFLSVTFALP